MTWRHTILLAVIVFAFACETERKLFDGPYFVRFTETTLTQKESYTKPIDIEVHLAGPVPKSDVTITYKISGTAREGIDYVFVGKRGEVEIESGEYFGKVTIQLINNSNNIIRSQDIVLKLLTIDAEGIQVGQGVSSIGNEFRLTIQDDCILGGNYYAIRTPSDVPVTDITVSSSDCNEYVLSNWNIYNFEYFIFFSMPDLLFVDNGDNTLTIPPQEESLLDPDKATIDGSGVFDPTTRKITLSVRLVDEPDQPVFTFTLVPD
jgi:hypothetical protein